MVPPRKYDPDELVELLREHDGLTTSELAEKMDAEHRTTWGRCETLEDRGRVRRMIFGFGSQREVVWYPAE